MGIEFGINVYMTKTYQNDYDDGMNGSPDEILNSECINGSYLNPDKTQITFWDRVATFELGNWSIMRKAILNTQLVQVDEDGYFPAMGKIQMTLEQFKQFFYGFYNKDDRRGNFFTWDWIDNAIQTTFIDFRDGTYDVVFVVCWG